MIKTRDSFKFTQYLDQWYLKKKTFSKISLSYRNFNHKPQDLCYKIQNYISYFDNLVGKNVLVKILVTYGPTRVAKYFIIMYQ